MKCLAVLFLFLGLSLALPTARRSDETDIEQVEYTLGDVKDMVNQLYRRFPSKVKTQSLSRESFFRAFMKTLVSPASLVSPALMKTLVSPALMKKFISPNFKNSPDACKYRDISCKTGWN